MKMKTTWLTAAFSFFAASYAVGRSLDGDSPERTRPLEPRCLACRADSIARPRSFAAVIVKLREAVLRRFPWSIFGTSLVR